MREINSIKQISILYDLSLSVGLSLNMQDNCNYFAQALKKHFDLDFMAIWANDKYIPNDSNKKYSLLFNYPFTNNLQESKDISVLFNKLENTEIFTIIPATPYNCEYLGYMGKKEGEFALFFLKKIGFLVFHILDNTKNYLFEQELWEPLLNKFAISLESCITHENFIHNPTNTLQELEKTKKRADEADHLKASFISNLSHEIRTPVNAIVGFANLLYDAKLVKEEQNTFIKHIHSNSLKLLRLIEDIVDFSKLEAHQMELNTETHFLNPIVYEQYEGFQQQHSHMMLKEIQFKINTPDIKTDIQLSIDKARFHQIYDILLSNAFKFTNKGFVEMGYFFDKSGDNPIFFVRDSGIGIDPDKQKIIFDMFRQIDSGSTRKYGGAGLGLAINKKLVQLMGGKIWMESEIGKGSCFYFSLNNITGVKLVHDNIHCKTNLKESQLVKLDNIQFDFSNKTILIADDVQTNFYYLHSIIELTDANILWAKNGKEAVNICENSNTPIDIVLMDIRMPILNGMEAIKQIKSTNTQIPILVQTAFAMDNEKKKCYKAGADEFITKPIDPQILLNLLSRYLVQ